MDLYCLEIIALYLAQTVYQGNSSYVFYPMCVLIAYLFLAIRINIVLKDNSRITIIQETRACLILYI